jgi:hypothetical protein
VLDLAAEFRADYIFAGDFHGFVEKEFGPTKLIVSGCGGGSFGAPSKEVQFLKVEVEGTSTAVRKVRVAREPEIIARGAYLLHVQVPRYRWYFLCGTIAFLLLEVYHWKRSRWKAKKPQTNSFPSASAES